MDNFGLNLNHTLSNIKLRNDPSVYERFIQYRMEYVRYNWTSSKWYMQTLYVIASLVQIFKNELATREYIVDCFGAMTILLLIEVLFQLRHYDFFA